MTELELLVKEWRDAQRNIDETPVDIRKYDRAPMERLVQAHTALVRYAEEHLR